MSCVLILSVQTYLIRTFKWRFCFCESQKVFGLEFFFIGKFRHLECLQMNCIPSANPLQNVGKPVILESSQIMPVCRHNFIRIVFIGLTRIQSSDWLQVAITQLQQLVVHATVLLSVYHLTKHISTYNVISSKLHRFILLVVLLTPFLLRPTLDRSRLLSQLCFEKSTLDVGYGHLEGHLIVRGVIWAQFEDWFRVVFQVFVIGF